MGRINPTLDPAEIVDFRKGQFHDLRAELGHLKTCQTSLLIFSSAGAGIFIGLLRNESGYIHPAYLLLFPLIFLLPLWIIFYEKARSIARIVGFLRVQEKLYMFKSTLAVIGWESAMKKYWSKKDTWDNRILDDHFTIESSKKTATTSIYWFSVYCTFLILIVTCLVLSGIYLPIENFTKIGIIIAVILTLIESFYLLKLQNIGKQKQGIDTQQKKQVKHTNLKIFSKKAIYLSIFFMTVNGIFWILTFFVRENDNSILISQFFPLVIYLMFFTSFVLCVSITSWMFLNLVKGRYSYDLFEKRWQIILGIKIDEDNGVIEAKDWDATLRNISWN